MTRHHRVTLHYQDVDDDGNEVVRTVTFRGEVTRQQAEVYLEQYLAEGENPKGTLWVHSPRARAKARAAFRSRSKGVN